MLRGVKPGFLPFSSSYTLIYSWWMYKS